MFLETQEQKCVITLNVSSLTLLIVQWRPCFSRKQIIISDPLTDDVKSDGTVTEKQIF